MPQYHFCEGFKAQLEVVVEASMRGRRRRSSRSRSRGRSRRSHRRSRHSRSRSSARRRSSSRRRSISRTPLSRCASRARTWASSSLPISIPTPPPVPKFVIQGQGLGQTKSELPLPPPPPAKPPRLPLPPPPPVPRRAAHHDDDDDDDDAVIAVDPGASKTRTKMLAVKTPATKGKQAVVPPPRVPVSLVPRQDGSSKAKANIIPTKAMPKIPKAHKAKAAAGKPKTAVAAKAKSSGAAKVPQRVPAPAKATTKASTGAGAPGPKTAKTKACVPAKHGVGLGFRPGMVRAAPRGSVGAAMAKALSAASTVVYAEVAHFDIGRLHGNAVGDDSTSTSSSEQAVKRES